MSLPSTALANQGVGFRPSFPFIQQSILNACYMPDTMLSIGKTEITHLPPTKSVQATAEWEGTIERL